MLRARCVCVVVMGAVTAAWGGVVCAQDQTGDPDTLRPTSHHKQFSGGVYAGLGRCMYQGFFYLVPGNEFTPAYSNSVCEAWATGLSAEVLLSENSAW